MSKQCSYPVPVWSREIFKVKEILSRPPKPREVDRGEEKGGEDKLESSEDVG